MKMLKAGTVEEARSMKRYLADVHHMKSGEDGLKIIQMSEIPSNAIIPKAFLEEFDGFSLGSNDMTQMVLATDRDNARLSHIYDEEDPAVVSSGLSWLPFSPVRNIAKRSASAVRAFPTARCCAVLSPLPVLRQLLLCRIPITRPSLIWLRWRPRAFPPVTLASGFRGSTTPRCVS